jgi:hypothetical protein
MQRTPNSFFLFAFILAAVLVRAQQTFTPGVSTVGRKSIRPCLAA